MNEPTNEEDRPIQVIHQVTMVCNIASMSTDNPLSVIKDVDMPEHLRYVRDTIQKGLEEFGGVQFTEYRIVVTKGPNEAGDFVTLADNEYPIPPDLEY